MPRIPASRRSFLKTGIYGVGGLTLAPLLPWQVRADGSAASTRGKSVIFIELGGGPSHFETYDPKPEAPAECRGAYDAVATNVPGVLFSEVLGAQAQVMSKLAIVRSVHHGNASHSTSAHLAQTGYYLRNPQNQSHEMPAIGSVVSRIRGPNRQGMPAFVTLGQGDKIYMLFSRSAAYLGRAFDSFDVPADPNSPKFEVPNLTLPGGMDTARLEDRRGLLAALDNGRRILDSAGNSQAMDELSRQAFDLITGDTVRRAFNLGAEDPQLRDRYGRTEMGQCFLLARRLVEAGIAFVTVRTSTSGGWSWDHHSQIQKWMTGSLGIGLVYDRAMAALANDLYDHGLDQQVLVVAMGEFGRTPKINAGAGRDHWPGAMSVLFSGGGLRMGQVVGCTTDKGEAPNDKPYRPEDVTTMIYRHLGVDKGATFPDFAGRPRYVLEEGRPIAELI